MLTDTEVDDRELRMNIKKELSSERCLPIVSFRLEPSQVTYYPPEYLHALFVVVSMNLDYLDALLGRNH
jgi:hypothetical protein